MPTTPLPPDQTKVSYILLKSEKAKLEAAARNSGQSMSEVITGALTSVGVLGTTAKVNRSAESGKFVDRAAAKANPKTTVRQVIHRRKAKHA